MAARALVDLVQLGLTDIALARGSGPVLIASDQGAFQSNTIELP